MVSSRNSAALRAASWSSSIAPRTACSASLLQGAWRPANSDDRSAVEDTAGDADVIPGWSLPVGVTKQSGRVIRDDHRNPAEPVHQISHCAQRLLGVEHRLCRGPTHRENHRRLDQLDLPEQIGHARGDFIVLREPVLRRPALDHVTNEDPFPGEIYRLENLRE